jgi:hypothetical protein
LFDSLISVSIHCSKSQSGGGVCNKGNCYKTNTYAILLMTENNYYTITISHNKYTAALTLCRLPYKIRTHPIHLPICFLIFRNVYLARITTKAHEY